MISRFSCLSPDKAFVWYPEARVNVITGKPGSGKTRFLTNMFACLVPSPSFYLDAGTHFSIVVDGKENVLKYNSDIQRWHTTVAPDPSVLYATDKNTYMMMGKKLYRNEPGYCMPFSRPVYQYPPFLSLLGHKLHQLSGQEHNIPSVLHRYLCLCFYLHTYRPKTLLLDCPELYMHKTRLRYIPQLLLHIADHFDTQIIAMTGSKAIIAGNGTKNWVLTDDPPFISEAYWRVR